MKLLLLYYNIMLSIFQVYFANRKWKRFR